MQVLKRVLPVSFSVAFLLVVCGVWPDHFGLNQKASSTVAAIKPVPEWHAASEPISCTSGYQPATIGSVDIIPLQVNGEIAKGLVELFGIEESAPTAKTAPVCDDLWGHVERVENITAQIKSLADWSDVSYQFDERVINAMTRIGFLNSEREALYNHMDNCLKTGKLTPHEHEFISTMWIAPAWRNLADASTHLDQMIAARSKSKK